MKLRIFVLLSLIISLALADEEDYSFIKKFENGRLVPLAKGECPNLKDDPIVREVIAKRNKRKAEESSLTSVSTSVTTITGSSDATTNGDVTSSNRLSLHSQPSPATQRPTDTSTSITTVEATTIEDSCTIAFNGTCYWIMFYEDKTINNEEARQLCLNNTSTLAYFPNEEVYNKINEETRSKLPSGWKWVALWTAIIIDTSTGKVTYPDEDIYMKWHPTLPWTSYSARALTHVHLRVDQHWYYQNQGMIQSDPLTKLSGVVCQTMTN